MYFIVLPQICVVKYLLLEIECVTMNIFSLMYILCVSDLIYFKSINFQMMIHIFFRSLVCTERNFICVCASESIIKM